MESRFPDKETSFLPQPKTPLVGHSAYRYLADKAGYDEEFAKHDCKTLPMKDAEGV